jgi:predicted nucleic acid-binding protein
MPRTPVFVDTWAWLSLVDRAEPAHAAVTELRRQHAAQGTPWLTTDYVLDETITRIFARLPYATARQFAEGLFAAHKAGALLLEFITPERFAAAYRLRVKLADKPRISFTDLTSAAVMKELSIRQVLTADRHFDQLGLGLVLLN